MTDAELERLEDTIRNKWHEVIRGNERLRTARERALRRMVLRKLQAANRGLKAIGAEEITLADSGEVRTLREEIESLRFGIKMLEDASDLKLNLPGRPEGT